LEVSRDLDLEIIPSGIEARRFAWPRHAPSNELRLLFVGRLIPLKRDTPTFTCSSRRQKA
jgi:hypothetical protein